MERKRGGEGKGETVGERAVEREGGRENKRERQTHVRRERVSRRGKIMRGREGWRERWNIYIEREEERGGDCEGVRERERERERGKGGMAEQNGDKGREGGRERLWKGR